MNADTPLVVHTRQFLDHHKGALSENSHTAYATDLALVWRCLAVIVDPTVDPADTPAVDAAVDRLTVHDLTVHNLAGAFAHVRSGLFRGHGTGPRAASSSRRVLASATAFCRHQVRLGVMGGNPMDGVPEQRKQTVQPRSLSRTQETALLAAAAADPPPRVRIRWPSRDLAIVLIGLRAGLRASEIGAQTIGSIHGEPGDLRLHVRGKGSHERVVPVHPDLADALTDYLNELIVHGPPRTSPTSPRLRRRRGVPDDAPVWEHIVPGEPLFVSTTGKPMDRNTIYRLVDQIYRQAGMGKEARSSGVAVHALRHTFATRLNQQGVSAFDIQSLLGHESVSTTQQYVHTTDAELKGAISAIPSMAADGLAD